MFINKLKILKNYNDILLPTKRQHIISKYYLIDDF